MNKLTGSDVIHHFANRIAKEETGVAYSYRNDALFYNTLCVAKIISVRKKIVVIDNNFYRIGAFGNGHSWTTVSCSFSDEWIKLYGKPTEFLKYDKKVVYQFYLNTILESILDRVSKYINERKLIGNRLAYREAYYHINPFEPQIKLAEKLGINLRRVYKHVYNINHSTIIRYHGWGKPEYDSIKIDKPISFWLDESKWWDESERRILEFKKWKSNNTGNPYTFTGKFRNKTYLDIWKDDELRVEFEQYILDRKERKRKLREQEEEERNKLQIEENKKRFTEWFNGGNYTLFYIPIELRLREVMLGQVINSETVVYDPKLTQEVETTKGARVPFHHAERLFKFFKKCIAENRTYTAPNKHTEVIDTIGVYRLREINKNETGWYLLIGCHTIYEDAVDRFVERYKLSW